MYATFRVPSENACEAGSKNYPSISIVPGIMNPATGLLH